MEHEEWSCEREARSGTGSKPEGPKGRQRIKRRAANHEPRAAPNSVTASRAYSEHDGKNRHGDGRPSRPRWYPSMARRRNDFMRPRHLPGRPTGERSADPADETVDRWPGGDRRMTARRSRLGRCRRGTAPERGGSDAEVPAGGGECDYASRPFRPGVRWRRPPGLLHSRDRGASCTRAHRCEHVFPPGASAGSRVRGAVGRSSRQTVAALEATCLQHGSAGASGHTSAKAVLHRPALLVRLVRTLHERLLGPPRQRAMADIRHRADVSAQATGVAWSRATHDAEIVESSHFADYPQPARVTRP